MRDLMVLGIHLLVTLARLLRPGGVRAVAAESLILKHQVVIVGRSRRRAPNLTSFDRVVLGIAALFVSVRRIPQLERSRTRRFESVTHLRNRRCRSPNQSISHECPHGAYPLSGGATPCRATVQPPRPLSSGPSLNALREMPTLSFAPTASLSQIRRIFSVQSKDSARLRSSWYSSTTPKSCSAWVLN